MLHTAIKNLIAHRLRLMATALAVILGVALMAGTLVLTATMQRTFDNLFADVYRGTDAVVRAQATFEGLQNVDTAAQRGRVDASLMTSVQAVSGVAAADGSISGYARPIGSDGKALGNPATGGPNLGINWSDNPKLNTFTLVTGSAPRQDNEVVIDRKSSKDGHLRVGDSATVLVAGPPQRVVISGIARFGSADSPGGATIVAFRTPVAQRLIGEPGKFDAISLVATPGVSQTLLVERVARVLPTGTEAITGLAIIALLVGAFMIANTFSITVAQRTRENGLLRALGASRRQILASVVIEAIAIGVIASLVGLVAGIGVAIGLKALLSAVGIPIPSQGVVVTPSAMIISVVIGVGITTLAALSPARKAAKVPPIAAMQLGVVGSTGYGSKQRIFVGSGVLLSLI